MKKISFKSAITKENGSACTVVEYPLANKNVDFAIATITGRYPEARRVVNQQCDEIAYVAEGDGILVLEDQTHPLKKGDVVIIEAGERYYWQGNMKLMMTCRPAWSPEQHLVID